MTAETIQEPAEVHGGVHVSLLDPSLHLYTGAPILVRKKVLTFGAGYQFEADAVYGQCAAQTLSKDYQAWTFDGISNIRLLRHLHPFCCVP